MSLLASASRSVPSGILPASLGFGLFLRVMSSRDSMRLRSLSVVVASLAGGRE